MNLSTKIAWRNVWRHKSKSLIIGVILFLGAFLMTLGNAVVAGMETGLEKNLKGTFTGDIIVISDKEEKDAIFADITGATRELIPNYFDVLEVIKENKSVDKTLSMAFGMNFLLSDTADLVPVGVIGVDIKEFIDFYGDQYSIIEGRMLEEKETGILVGNISRRNVINGGDYWILPKGGKVIPENLSDLAKEYGDNLSTTDELVIMGSNMDGGSLDIRVPVVGVYKLKSLDRLLGDNLILDIDSYRSANGLVTGDAVAEISDELQAKLDNDLNFDDDFIVEASDEVSFEDLESTFAESSTEEVKAVNDSGAYNVISIKLAKGINEKEAIAELNNLFKEKGLQVRAISWDKSLGFIGQIALFIRAALIIFVSFIFFVAIIVIMNTLSMTAMERVSEIGMMRAVGGQKSFLRSMFVKETAYLSFFFGGIGIISGIVLSLILQMLKLETQNEFLQLAYGGDYLNPIVRIGDLFLGIIQLGIVTLLSLLYPIKLVGKITPLDAISRD